MSLASRCLRPSRLPSRAALLPPVARRTFSPSISTSRLFAPAGQHRSFQAGPIINSVFDGTQSIVLGLHHVTGTPWCITIPLFAIGVAAIFRLPFTINNQKILQQRTKYNSVMQAWTTHIGLKLARGRLPPEEKEKAARKEMQREMTRVFKRAGLQQWKLYSSIISLPFWLLAIDAVRRLCGGPNGLLGMLFRSDSGRPATNAGATASGTTPDPITMNAAAGDVSTAAAGAVDVTTNAVDPALMTEGALWFTDLTAPDPYHILPLALSAVMIYNVIPKQKDRARELFGLEPVNEKEKVALDSGVAAAARRGISRALLVLAVMVGPLTMNLPAAVHLYWLTSSCTNAAFGRLVSKRYPVHNKLITPCQGRELPLIRPRGPKGAAATTQAQKTTDARP